MNVLNAIESHTKKIVETVNFTTYTYNTHIANFAIFLGPKC